MSDDYNWGESNDEVQGTSQEEGYVFNSSNQGVESPKKSWKSYGLIAVAFIGVLIVVLLTFHSCSIEKKSAETDVTSNGAEQLPENQDNSTVSTQNEMNQQSSETEESEKVAPNTDNSLDSTVENTPSESSVNSSDSESSIKTVESVPNLGDSKTSSVLVSNKKIYEVGNKSYAYSIGLILPSENDDFNVITYFCSKKTFDGVSMGDSVNIEYQTDAQDVVSVTSISKS